MAPGKQVISMIKCFYMMNMSTGQKTVIKIFLVWLLLLLIVGFLSPAFSLYGGKKCNVKNQLPYYRWDSFWYTSISRHGYTFSEDKNSAIAYFPLYPLTIKFFHLISRVREDYLSFILNIIFSFFASLYLYRLSRFDHAEKTSLMIVAIWLFFPSSYFLLSGYPEALFVLLAILSLFFSRKKRWLWAGVSVALLAVTKPYGIFMLPVLFFEYAATRDWNYKIFFKKFDWLPFFLPILTLGAFIFFNYWKFGNPLAFLAAQKTWGRSLASPVSALLEEARHYLLDGNIFSGGNFPYLIYLSSFFFSIFAFFLSWKKARRSYLIFPVLILIAAFLTGTLTSWDRYMLLGFPLLIGPAVYLSGKKYLFAGYFLASVLVLFTLASLFVRCYPVE